MSTTTARAAKGRAHVGLEVSDLERSISFYRDLLGVEPCKVRPGYAKFEPADPPLVLSLIEGPGGRAPAGSWHLGVRVSSSEEVRAAELRLRAAGRTTRVERGTECCYALQDKVWVRDPDGHPWEVYTVLDTESATRREGTAPGCCVGEAPASC